VVSLPPCYTRFKEARLDTLTITRPDDWHLHLRDGTALPLTVAATAGQFARAIVMPNLAPPITNAAQAAEYASRIQAAIPADRSFQPLMTLYLTDNTTAEIIKQAHSANISACKLYPAGATTNSDSGVSSIDKCYDALAAMSEAGMPLLVHGETTAPDVDIFDREQRFIDETLFKIRQDFPALKIVLEHITTSHGIDFVKAHTQNTAGTLTAHHLLLNRNAMLVGGIRPHYYCLPVLKRETHRLALLDAATSGDARFFLGTDSAPHARHKKESACGCAGMFTAHAAIELYAEAFEQAGALDKLEAFASFFGPDFYGLPRNTDTITLTREAWTVPESYAMDSDTLIPFRAGETISWKLSS